MKFRTKILECSYCLYLASFLLISISCNRNDGVLPGVFSFARLIALVDLFIYLGSTVNYVLFLLPALEWATFALSIMHGSCEVQSSGGYHSYLAKLAKV